jgi:phosphoglycolate phosphatase
MPLADPSPTTFSIEKGNRMNAPARLCIFDLDGTLADTAPDLVAALNRVLEEEGLPSADFDTARAFVGHGARVLIERAHRAHGIELDDQKAVDLTERFVSHYADHIAEGTVLFPHVLEAMDTMEADGWQFAICTNKRESLARQLLQGMNLTHRFRAICGGDTFAERKPSGRHILKTAEAAGAGKARILMIGDSAPDVLAAQDAGVPVVAVSFGYSNEPIATLNPTAIISGFDALPDLAEELVPAKAA